MKLFDNLTISVSSDLKAFNNINYYDYLIDILNVIFISI